MELSLTILLISGIGLCIAAPLDKPNNISSICVNSSELLTNQGDIFKNCHNFTDLNNTLCTLYYNSLSSYCQLNKNIVNYPTLQEIQKNDYGFEDVCKTMFPSFKTILKKDVKIPICYYLCAEPNGIKPECLYAYYYNTSKNSNLPGDAIRTAEVSTAQVNQTSSKLETVAELHSSTEPKTGTEKPKNEKGQSPDESPRLETDHKGEVEAAEKPPDTEVELKVIHPDTANRDNAEITGVQQSSPDKSSLTAIPLLDTGGQQSTNGQSSQVAVPQHPVINENEHEINHKSPTAHHEAPVPIVENSPHDAANVDPEEYLEEINEAPTSQRDALNKVPQQDVVDEDDKVPQQDIVDTPAKQDDVPKVAVKKSEKKPDFVEDNPVDSENIDDIDGESYFFTYFMVICILFILGYVGYHNRLKVFALLLEGKRGKRQYRGRRPNSANYHKLDTNLEEAISSNVTKTPTNVIF